MNRSRRHHVPNFQGGSAERHLPCLFQALHHAGSVCFIMAQLAILIGTIGVETWGSKAKKNTNHQGTQINRLISFVTLAENKKYPTNGKGNSSSQLPLDIFEHQQWKKKPRFQLETPLCKRSIFSNQLSSNQRVEVLFLQLWSPKLRIPKRNLQICSC